MKLVVLSLQQLRYLQRQVHITATEMKVWSSTNNLALSEKPHLSSSQEKANVKGNLQRESSTSPISLPLARRQIAPPL